MRFTYLRRPCKPWPRFGRDTCRVNESPREAREHFASRLKAWVRFRPRMFFLFFFVFQKIKELSPPPPQVREQIESLGSIPTYMYRRCTKHVQKMYNIFRILIKVLLSMPRLGGVKINV